MADLADLLPIASEAAERGGEIIRNRTPGLVTAKGDRDMVTEVDYAVEDAVRDFLAGETPEVGFLGEESGTSGDSGPGDLRWVLDPVDGTANFVRGVPLNGISLGLMRGDVSVLGVIGLPFLGLRYCAAQGRGATCDGRRVQVSGTVKLRDAIIALGDYAVGEGSQQANRARLRITEQLAARAQRVRMFGSAAIDLVWVAEGRVEGSVMLANKPWDTSAGSVIAREAGAVVVDQDGSPHSAGSVATLALAPGIADEVIELVGTAVADSAT